MPHPKKLCFHISQNFEVQVNSHCAVSAAGINTGDRRPIVRQFGKFDLTTSTQHQPTQTIINMQRFVSVLTLEQTNQNQKLNENAIKDTRLILIH